MRLVAFAALVLGFLTIGTAFAADPITMQLSSLDEQTGRISATVTINGPDGRPITGLSTANFKAALGDAPLNVSDLYGSSASRQPASIVLLVDVSGSMGGDPINQAKAAMSDFVRTLDAGDRVAVISFGNKVTLVQDYSSDKTALYQSIGRITTAGDTALYEGVIAGLQKISEAPPGRRLVVLLSDGSATTSLNRRTETIGAATAVGVNIVAIGLGKDIDRPYLTDLSTASGGRLTTASSSTLRSAYAEVAAAIRAQYTVVISVPKSVDRSVPNKLTLTVTLRADSSTVERDLDALPGALPPPFDVKLTGLKANQKLPQKGAVTLTPKLPAGSTVTNVDYLVDGKVIYSATTAPFKYELKMTSLPPGSHLISAKASDATGRTGEAQAAFRVLPPPKQSPFSSSVFIVAMLGGLVAVLAFFVLRKQKAQLQGLGRRVASRVRPFAKHSDQAFEHQIDGWPTSTAPSSPIPVPVNRALGRIVVMDEAAVRGGNLDAIREYEIRTEPLTLGTGDACDIQLKDEQGRIAAEEARLWVQRNRLVYHKLTTLSAMATEGVTSGWEFLESGEEMRLGAYRLLFEEYLPGRHEEPEEPEPAVAAEPLKPTQEHGMSLSDIWTKTRDEVTQPGE